MDDLGNSIKHILYDYLQLISEEKFQNYIRQKQSSVLIKSVISQCYSKIILLNGEDDEKSSIFATILLHYLLTNALIPSNRKITINDINIDLVIPDTKTLIADPKNSLIICIPEKFNKTNICTQLEKILKIQPNNENIWLVLHEQDDFNFKTYSIHGDSFTNIIDDVERFFKNKKQFKFKIFKN